MHKMKTDQTTEVIKIFIMIISTDPEAIVGILTFMSRINSCFVELRMKVSLILTILMLIRSFDFMHI